MNLLQLPAKSTSPHEWVDYSDLGELVWLCSFVHRTLDFGQGNGDKRMNFQRVPSRLPTARQAPTSVPLET
jgi:hypothetical protein